MQRKAILCDGSGSQPGSATVALMDDGQVELVFCEIPEGEPRLFTCSLSSLMDVILGFPKDIASETGTCKLSRGPGRIIMSVAPWEGPHQMYLVTQDEYTDALIRLFQAKTSDDLAVT
jgi:hypothetical protein